MDVCLWMCVYVFVCMRLYVCTCVCMWWWLSAVVGWCWVGSVRAVADGCVSVDVCVCVCMYASIPKVKESK